MRKCVLVSLALLIGWGTAFSQDEGSEGGYFDAGDMAFEVTGSPFGNDAWSSSSSSGKLLSFGSLRARYAVTTNIVPRLGINVGLSNEQDTPDAVTNRSSYLVRPGCEYHFRVENGFRSYAALDVLVGQGFSSYESTTSYSIDGATSVNIANRTATNKGYFLIGVGIGVGAEYHLNSRFYIGTEVGFNLAQSKMNEVFVDGELFQESTKNSSVTMNTLNAIRIGFKFL
ncbi:hypothetical protein [Marinoscillum sp.]|uniref:hypothetical protein n=1 Tax=Marinoscillum sp. TaxID=2024838 RepID=UPI003BAC78AB